MHVWVSIKWFKYVGHFEKHMLCRACHKDSTFSSVRVCWTFWKACLNCFLCFEIKDSGFNSVLLVCLQSTYGLFKHAFLSWKWFMKVCGTYVVFPKLSARIFWKLGPLSTKVTYLEIETWMTFLGYKNVERCIDF